MKAAQTRDGGGLHFGAPDSLSQLHRRDAGHRGECGEKTPPQLRGLEYSKSGVTPEVTWLWPLHFLSFSVLIPA